MDYLAYGAVITNRLMYTNGTCIRDVMGGGGFYAYTGLRMCTPDCLLIAGVGNDFDEYYGEWFDRNACSRAGLRRTVDKTTYNELVYAPDGTYVEGSIYGAAYEAENYPKTLLGPDAFLPWLREAKALCINSGLEGGIREMLLREKAHASFRVMWELPASSIPVLAGVYARQGMDGLREALRVADVFSLNRPESFEIFGVSTEKEAVRLLLETGIPCYYRVGKRGAYMLADGRCAYVPMVSLAPREREIDPTGCGNTSTAAAMWAWCEGFDLLKTCVVGNVVAAYNVQQYGPYPDARKASHDALMRQVERIYAERIKGGAAPEGALYGQFEF